MKFDLRCVLTIEADNGQEAFNKLMDFVAKNGIELTVSVVDDDEFERMTAEGLHSESDIAAELAHRDRQIRELSDALAWTAQRLRDVLARRPVRDATECLANADRLTGSDRS